MRYIDYFRLTQAVSADTRLNYLRVVVAGAYVSGMLISPVLWFGWKRTFPRAPIVNGLPAFLSSADYLLSFLLIASLLLAAASRRPRRYLAAVVVLTGLLVIIDQTRLQPWVYQYIVMLAVLAFRQPGAADEAAAAPTLAANQLAVACLYFWSGAQKLNWSFGHEVLPALLESTGVRLPEACASYLPAAGIAVALCEALVGVALLVRKTRQMAVSAAIGIHFLVLLMLIIAWRNSVVWPWNIGMMVMVALLFRRSGHAPLRQVFRRARGSGLASHVVKAVFVICGLAPALSFAGWWDMYLSAALYSGNTPVAVVRISERARSRLSEAAQQQVFTTRHGELMLPFYEWSLAELNAPPYPESRVYRKLARQMCGYADDQSEIELIVRERPSLLDGSYAVTRVNCVDLFAR